MHYMKQWPVAIDETIVHNSNEYARIGFGQAANITLPEFLAYKVIMSCQAYYRLLFFAEVSCKS